jgi:CDP-diacylglycerol--glycerol-3-phosphate 3-phosphatidyltransferase
MLNLPTALTWFRIILIPVLVAVYFVPDSWLTESARNWLGAAVFAVACFTDYFDGYLARKLKATSRFGAFLDPVADKLIVATALVLLVAMGELKGLWSLLAIIIIGREIAVSALREWMAELGQSKPVAVAMVGKFKTAAQMVAIVALLLRGEPVIPGLSTRHFGIVVLTIAALLTLWSMFHYLRMAAPHFRK